MRTKSDRDVFPIGIGTWNIASTFVPDLTAKYKGAKPLRENEDVEIDAIKYSISKGQNHLDCAELYGGFYTDEVVGRAIARLNREDLYIADKLWKTSVEKGLVRPTVVKMLEKLRTNYLDLLYIHAPWPEVSWQDAISQIDDLIDEGLVRGFGVSNFTITDMKEAQSLARHPIIANQMNYNVLYKDEVTDEFRDYCTGKNIQIVAYQPVKRQEVLGNSTIQSIANKYHATSAQVALAWLLAQGALPIPKATNRQHIDENVAAVDVLISDEDMETLNSLRVELRSDK